MKKSKKWLFLGTLSVVTMPIVAFTLVSQGPGTGTSDEDEDSSDDQTHDITNDEDKTFGIGEDQSDGNGNEHVIASVTVHDDGTVTINIDGDGTIDGDLFSKKIKKGLSITENGETKKLVIKEIIVSDGVNFANDSSSLFTDFENDGDIKFNINASVSSNSTDIGRMLKGQNLEGIDVSDWNISNVTKLPYLFENTKNADLDLSNWQFREDLTVYDFGGMFNNTNGQIKLNGKTTKFLFNGGADKKHKPENKKIMTLVDDDTNTRYGIFDEDGEIVGYLNDSNSDENDEYGISNTPDESLINKLDDNITYTFKKAPTTDEIINKFTHLNEAQKEALKEKIKEAADIPEVNEIISNTYALDSLMEKLIEANKKLQTYDSNKDKYTEDFNNKVENLNNIVSKIVDLNNAKDEAKKLNAEVDGLITQINQLVPEERQKSDEVSDSSDSSDSSSGTTGSSTSPTKNGNTSTHEDTDSTKDDTNAEIKSLLPEYKDSAINRVDLLESLNKAQKDALKEEIKNTSNYSEVNDVIKKAEKLNKTMSKLHEISSNELDKFVREINSLNTGLKNKVKELNDQITKLINTSNADPEVNKNTSEVETLINKVRSLLINYKQNAKNKIDSLNYLNKAQKDALKEEIDNNNNPSKLDKVVSSANKLNDKMFELNNVTNKTLNEFIKNPGNISEDLKNEVIKLNSQVRNVINTQNTDKSVDKNKYEVQELINQINKLLQKAKRNAKNQIDFSKNYKYLNRAQKEDLKNRIDNVNSKKELDNVWNYTSLLDNKMKQLSVATVTDLQSIIDLNNESTNTKALDLKNEIYPYLELNTCSLDNNISSEEIDKYITKINNLKGIENSQSAGIIDGVIRTKKMHSGFILMNIFATTLALIVTAVIIKRYKNRK